MNADKDTSNNGLSWAARRMPLFRLAFYGIRREEQGITLEEENFSGTRRT
jgi:hypothetical protein